MSVSRVLNRFVFRALLPAFALVGVACGSTSTSVTGPTATKCDVAVANNTPQLPASGGNGTITVTTARDCTWTASTEASWISLGATSGQGPGTLNYVVQANPVGTARQARLMVAQQPIDVAEAAAACRYDVSPSNVSVDAPGQQVSIALTATGGCQWTVRADSPWIGSYFAGDWNGRRDDPHRYRREHRQRTCWRRDDRQRDGSRHPVSACHRADTSIANAATAAAFADSDSVPNSDLR